MLTAPDVLLSLHRMGHAEIELNLINSQVHIAQIRCLPGWLMSTHPIIILVSQEPRILLIENFLPAADCQVTWAVSPSDRQMCRCCTQDLLYTGHLG